MDEDNVTMLHDPLVKNSTNITIFKEQFEGYGALSRNAITTYAIQFIVGILVFVFNGISVGVVSRVKKMKHATANILGHLSVALMCFGLSQMLRCGAVLAGYRHYYICLTSLALTVTSGGVSITGISLLCLDTYLCVKNMLILNFKLPKKVLYPMTSSVWVVWFLIGHVGIVYHSDNVSDPNECSVVADKLAKPHIKLFIGLMLLHFIPITFFQLMTSYYLRKYKKSILNESAVIEGQGENPNQTLVAMQQKRLKVTSRTNMLVLFILVFYTCTYGIFIFLMALWLLCPSCIDANTVIRVSTVGALYQILNPLIYATRSKEMKFIYMNIICFWKKIQVDVELDTTT